MRTHQCRDCGAPIVHGITPNGRRIPLNPSFHPRGDTYANVAVYRHSTGRLNARVLGSDDDLESYERRALVHYATCTARAGTQANRRPQLTVVK